MLLRLSILISAILIGSIGANAWSPMGHHVTGVIAYDILNEDDRAEVMELLTHIPDFQRHFASPKGVGNQGSIDRWRIGVAGAWPDIIRGTDLDRPSWHYQLGSNLVIGSVSGSQIAWAAATILRRYRLSRCTSSKLLSSA